MLGTCFNGAYFEKQARSESTDRLVQKTSICHREVEPILSRKFYLGRSFLLLLLSCLNSSARITILVMKWTEVTLQSSSDPCHL